MPYSEADRLHRMNEENRLAQLSRSRVIPDNPVFLEPAAIAIQDHVRKMVTSLESRFPSGLRFPGRIFHYTGHIITDERRQQGERVAILTSKGEMIMVRAFVENPYGEWDLDIACPDVMTSADVNHQAIKLLDVMEIDRLEKVMLPEAIREGDADRKKKIRKDLARIRRTKKAIKAQLDKPVGTPNQDPQPTT